MQMLSTFFPRYSRSPRTVVHAGRLLLKRDGGTSQLQRYLRRPSRREVFLVHHGQEPLRDVAKRAGIPDIAVDTTVKQEANVTAEMTLALGARSLDFTIDEPAVRGPDGEPLRRIRASEAESLSRDPRIRPRIRSKLRAGCDALRSGVTRVRIGDPNALAENRATTLLLDPPAADAIREVTPRDAGPSEEAERSGPTPPPAPALVLRGEGRPATAMHYEPRVGRCEVAVPSHEPAGALYDPWWRLRGYSSPVSTRRRSKRLLAA